MASKRKRMGETAGPSTSSKSQKRVRGGAGGSGLHLGAPAPLTDVHRAFLQRLMAEQVLDKTNCTKMLKEVFADFRSVPPPSENPEEDEDEAVAKPPSLIDVIHDLNSNLTKYGFAIKSKMFDGHGQWHYAFVNTDPVEKFNFQSRYDPKTARMYELMAKACIESENGIVPVKTNEDTHMFRQDTTLNLSHLGHNAAMSPIGDMLSMLVDDKWLDRTSEGHYFLAPRSYIECDAYLHKAGAMRAKDGTLIIRQKNTWNWGV